MPRKKLNCWEYMECERGPNGKKVAEYGPCPAAVEDSYGGINDGEYAGRICWAVAGTCCGGKVQGTFAEKRASCTSCEFYQRVQKEEGNLEKINKLFNLFTPQEKEALFSKMTCKVVKTGDRFIQQGEIRDSAFIIERGSCLVLVEKNGEIHPVDHRGMGDIVGVTSILTGEPQPASVEAETEMQLWVLNASMLNEISFEHPELADLLTEIVASRFDSNRPVADRTISKYIASDIIGRGAFSIVYKGLHAGLDMPVTIKMMKHDMAMNPDFLDRFRSEAQILARMNHENIVQVYDIEERYRTIFIIMEHLTGKTLEELLTPCSRLPFERVMHFLVQICRGLLFAHRSGIVHQDIKPGNIFILPNDNLKILDFGLACPSGSENFMMGTPSYMSPEQIQCLPVDQRSDIFSLGLIAYEMIAGRKPFEGKNSWETMERYANQDIPDPAGVVSDIPATLRDFIITACARNPSARFQDISEALSLLEPLALRQNGDNGNTLQRNRNLQTFYLLYGDEHRHQINALINDFSRRLQAAGMELKNGDRIELA